jgi:hypothetical protein
MPPIFAVSIKHLIVPVCANSHNFKSKVFRSRQGKGSPIFEEGEMADTGAKKSKKLEQEEEQNELDKVGRTSEEIALDHELEEGEESADRQRQSGRGAGPSALTSEEDLEAGEDQKDELRHADEQIEQQDLNQGMDTGTHDSTRHGVDWGKSFQSPAAKGRKPKKKG